MPQQRNILKRQKFMHQKLFWTIISIFHLLLARVILMLFPGNFLWLETIKQ
ncbi:hypothetical protein LINPERHAP1_LOCUS14396 [Linum perenne]